jgi:hypothetical protein
MAGAEDYVAQSTAFFAVQTEQTQRQRGRAAPVRNLTDDKNKTLIDAFAVLGGKKEESQFYYKALALSQPMEFERLRATAMEKVGTLVNESFASSFEAYLESGYSKQEAELEAMRTAGGVKDAQMRAFRSKFNSDNEELYTSSNARQGGLVSTALPKARKAKAKKRK